MLANLFYYFDPESHYQYILQESSSFITENESAELSVVSGADRTVVLIYKKSKKPRFISAPLIATKCKLSFAEYSVTIKALVVV